MKKTLFQIVLMVLCITAQAQKVSNVRAEQRGQEIVVFYSLETSSPCEVSLVLSQNNGATWSSALKNVSGDVGKNITAGNKQITWNVLEEREQLVGDQIQFKVVANGKKSFEPEMVFVEGGTFQMGSNFGEEDEKPVHSVTLSSFKIGKYEVTQEQWKAVMGSVPSYSVGCDNCPIETVSWNDVQLYISKLNNQTGKYYRLPTEAEWEFAARGGIHSREFTFSGSNNIGAVAWFADNTGKEHDVGGKQANELGIYDMSGNVWEWCSDWYGSYGSYNQTNPRGASSGEERVLRGGGFYNESGLCRSTNRNGFMQDGYEIGSGFRLVHPFGSEIPSFPGGDSALCNLLSSNINYPESARQQKIEGTVYIRFFIEADGTPSNFEIERGVDGGEMLDKEALRVCRQVLPKTKWNPGKQDGRAVRVWIILPIRFTLRPNRTRNKHEKKLKK
jgi:TonB family protein